MHERYSWPQSHDLFLAHVNRQFLCRETQIEGGGEDGGSDGGGGGGPGMALNGEKSNHSSIWMM